MNLGLVHAVIHDNDKEAIKQLDDCFEDNHLQRCENEFKVYFSLVPDPDPGENYVVDSSEYPIKPNFRKFNSAEAAEAFKKALLVSYKMLNDVYFIDSSKFVIESTYKKWKSKLDKLKENHLTEEEVEDYEEEDIIDEESNPVMDLWKKQLKNSSKIIFENRI